MPDAQVVSWMTEKYNAIAADLDERVRRRWAAAEARSFGWGGVVAVEAATGISERTIRRGIKELDDPRAAPASRQRNPGAGRRSRETEQPNLTADCGGSNSPRTRLWRVELQKLANEAGLTIELCHFPPGTSRWNKIEHRLFCHITRNWQCVPLETYEIVVNLISQAKTTTGLEVHAWLDEKQYDKGRKVTDAELDEVVIKRNNFHAEWNYEIQPSRILKSGH